MSTFRAALVGFVVAVIVLVVGDARRVQSAVSVPNTVELKYPSIAPGASSSSIALPANDSPITVSAAVLSGPTRGSASVVITHTTAAPATLCWSGQFPVVGGSGGTAVGGSTTATGTDITPLNSTATILLRVSNTLNRIEIFNGSSEAISAVLELNY